MHVLISSVVDIFQSAKNPAAHRLAAELAHLPDYDFAEQYSPTPLLQHLKTTLEAPQAHPFGHEIVTRTNQMPWETMSRENASAEVKSGLTYCRIVGPDGLIRSDNCRMGFYLQAPDMFYPSHSHNAEEIYFVLSGTALWQKDNAPFIEQTPGTLIHHLPNQPHTMHTQKEPLLAIWGWIGDIDFDSYQFD